MHAQHYKDVYENQDTLWWYQGMRYLSSFYLRKLLPSNKKAHILDAGCGPGAALPFLSHYGNTVGVDISSEALKYAKKRGNAIKADVSALPFKKNTFDCIYSFGVLYHIWVKDDRRVLSEYLRVLKPGGILILEEPALAWLMGNEDAIAFGKHRYYRGELQTKLMDSSFRILKSSYVNFFLLPFAILRRLPQVIGLASTEKKSDIFRYPNIINSVCFAILRLESHMLQYINFPIGMDVFCIAQKKKANTD